MKYYLIFSLQIILPKACIIKIIIIYQTKKLLIIILLLLSGIYLLIMKLKIIIWLGKIYNQSINILFKNIKKINING